MGNRVITILVLLVGLATATFASQPPPARWPPPGVFAPEDVDTPPKVVSRVAPDYTPEAMRSGVAGGVLLQCVVQADGSVGDVRVLTSLDAVHGLDQAAIAALKQWRFQPAVKDGKPVPTTARVELTFTLGRDSSSPLFSWPRAFEDAAAAGSWHTDEPVASDLRFHIEYPEGWSLRRDPKPGDLVEIKNTALGVRLAIRTLAPTPASFERPFEEKDLKAIADRMQPFAATNRSIAPQSRGFGEVNAGGRIWVWSEWYIRTEDQKDLPDELRALAGGVIEGTTAWTFQTAAAGQSIVVQCLVMLPASTTEEERLQRRNQAAAQLGAILRRMTIKPSQP